MFKDDLRSSVDVMVLPMTRAMSWLGITPDMVTFANFGVNLAAAFFLAKGRLIWAGILILFAGVLDHMDGAVARMTNRARPSGALLDSVVDRYSEIVVFFGLLAYFYHLNSNYSFYGVCLVFLAISGSVLVSYIRARAEGLGIECKVGIMQRLERICLITIGILAQGVFQSFYGKLQFYGKLESEGLILIIVFLILTIGTHLTAAHRLIFCYRQLNL